MRGLVIVLLLGACTSFSKVGGGDSDVGISDAGPLDGGFEDGLVPFDAQMPADADAGPAPDTSGGCVEGIDTGGGLMDPPTLESGRGSYDIYYSFAQLRGRFVAEGTGGMPCPVSPTASQGIELEDDGSFWPVEGGVIELLGDTFTIHINGPREAGNILGHVNETGFGESLAVEGSVVAVGAPRDRSVLRGVHPEPDMGNPPGLPHGAVHIFRLEGANFEREAFLNSDEPLFLPASGSERFGAEVHLSGGLLVVSAPGYNTNDTDYGRLFTFRREERSWDTLGVIERPSSQGPFLHGRSDGTNVYGTLPRLNEDRFRGVVRTFSHEAMAWEPGTDISLESRDDGFGNRVEVEGDIMIVEQEVTEANDTSQLHLLVWDGGAWVLGESIDFSNPAPSPDHVFGRRSLFATDGTWAAVLDDSRTTIYRVDDGEWEPQGTIGVGSLEVRALDIRHGRVAVGRPDIDDVTVYVMTWEEGGVVWRQQGLMHDVRGADEADALFGRAVALSESDGLLVGAPNNSEPSLPFWHGGVYLFQ